MVELEFDSHSSDDEIVIPPLEDVGEPSALAEKSVGDKNFVSVHTCKFWDNIC